MKHYNNFRDNDACPYFKNTVEFDEAMAGPPKKLFTWVEGCVPPTKERFAFVSNDGTAPKAVNLQVLLADLVFHFSRLSFGHSNPNKTEHYKNHTTPVHYKIDKYVYEDARFLLSQKEKQKKGLNLKYEYDQFNNQFVKKFWGKLFVHLSWMITMNRNSFPHSNDNTLKMTPKVLESVKHNCRILLQLCKCCAPAGHGGRYFIEKFSGCCWPKESDIGLFSHTNPMEAFGNARNSMKDVNNSINAGVCCTYQSKLGNKAYWDQFSGSPCFVYTAVFYMMFSSKNMISSASALCTADLQRHKSRGIEWSFDELYKVGFYTEHQGDFFSFLRKVVEWEGSCSNDLAKYPLERDDIITIRKDLQRNYESMKRKIGRKDIRDQKEKVFLFGDTIAGWYDFVQKTKKTGNPKVRLRFTSPSSSDEESLGWQPYEMESNSDRWIMQQCFKTDEEEANDLEDDMKPQAVQAVDSVEDSIVDDSSTDSREDYL